DKFSKHFPMSVVLEKNILNLHEKKTIHERIHCPRSGPGLRFSFPRIRLVAPAKLERRQAGRRPGWPGKLRRPSTCARLAENVALLPGCHRHRHKVERRRMGKEVWNP